MEDSELEGIIIGSDDSVMIQVASRVTVTRRPKAEEGIASGVRQGAEDKGSASGLGEVETCKDWAVPHLES